MAKERMGTRARLASVDQSIQARLMRVRKRLLPILQMGIAAGIAYWIAGDIIGNAKPFFAPISVVIIIGMSGGERITKAIDLSIGCALGVLVGDSLFYRLGDGGWQIAAIVSGSLLIASFFSKSQLVNNQVAIGSILIATIMPPGAEVTGFDRTIDAAVGCLVALATIALIPQGPMEPVRAEISNLMGLMSSVLDDVASGLTDRDPLVIDDALEAIRGSQTDIDDMASAVNAGKETTKISPFLWGARRYINSLSLVIPPVDNAVRSCRVLARRALVLCEDGDHVSPQQIELIDVLAKACLDISEVYEVKSRRAQATVIPQIVNELRAVAQGSSVDMLEKDAVLSEYAILAQTRSLTVDLLQVCGMSRESALAALAPTSDTPAYPPESFDLR
ncbi:aromatic acid exporter family protein [Corynebacterium sp. CCUG 18816]|uniref:FUSC family protein n=1 Tax=Corynebacterium pseudogenitalium TaxID=38303 RepID=UPI00210B76E2|nr:FUSC family protein [Corynebacterium pseudogenitalium]MCQ4616437.1 aromatic acid exporter family protein [Corynebacterium pseudogenitalium]